MSSGFLKEAYAKEFKNEKDVYVEMTLYLSMYTQAYLKKSLVDSINNSEHQFYIGSIKSEPKLFSEICK